MRMIVGWVNKETSTFNGVSEEQFRTILDSLSSQDITIITDAGNKRTSALFKKNICFVDLEEDIS